MTLVYVITQYDTNCKLQMSTINWVSSVAQEIFLEEVSKYILELKDLFVENLKAGGKTHYFLQLICFI